MNFETFYVVFMCCINHDITVSVPEEVYQKMKKYSEIRWSEVVRKALREYMERLERLKATERDIRPLMS